MTVHPIRSLIADRWIDPGPEARPVHDAVTGAQIGRAGGPLDVDAMLAHARGTGGPALRAMGLHDRTRMVKAVALHLRGHRDALYEASYATGGTLADHRIDVDGGIGTMLVFASKGRREMPDHDLHVDGGWEPLGRTGAFGGLHVCTPLTGAAVHINAFNFPVWGMLEKLAPTLLAGMPAIVKPATATAQVTELCVRLIHESGLLPPGALQMVAGGLGDTLDRLGCQDVVTFTGSAATALHLRANANLLRNAVRFTAEQDSLNASLLGPDAGPGTPEFDLYVKEAAREMTAKAGQKCTATRRLIVPAAHADALQEALSARLAEVTVGDPRAEGTRMGALVSQAQRANVLEKVATLRAEADLVHGATEGFAVAGADAEAGAFLPPLLLRTKDADAASRVHDTEAFGPVSTILPYRDLDHAIALANRGGGSLVTSLVTHDPDVLGAVVRGVAPWNGRIYSVDRDSAPEATGHGAPMPHLVHGGPGRAGGGEELGGIRAVLHFMQRTAVQGSPRMLSALTARHLPGAPTPAADVHPFRKRYGEMAIGETHHAGPRTVTLDDIETFAHFTGDTFYAHMDAEAAARNPFFPGRVAHGYLLLSFAAGLFVDPVEGPVLANTGLDRLRFLKPVEPGTPVSVRLTVARKTRRTDDYGEVRWDVEMTDAEGDAVATYELMTMVRY
ncbi:phenylacetic acid degradation bifunctional protein PaaZ [Jannaschia sp. Os4]|uniref:phenylacetic acid degradation bifunctional protein PaaZ n=1 Tax=Jannaschia sp. Os4 TaxID=2807617 RepID=UPI00193941F3|nr:phenylacetic acid degradation bifunctional protein PaaZ [Jannaschia sp. Os4]MBM2577865.1 phenylacetic acid degradation bifunctional protein PaaZ [Jannaschia sp. Os4]